jgi:hypothetical protein
VRLYGFLHFFEFRHKFFIYFLPARSVNNNHIPAPAVGILDRRQAYCDRFMLITHAEYRQVKLSAEHFQLFYSCRTVDVRRGHERPSALFAQKISQLGGGGCFTGAVQANHH